MELVLTVTTKPNDVTHNGRKLEPYFSEKVSHTFAVI